MPPKKRSYLTQLFGTATKVRIFEQLCMDPTPVTKHALSKQISNSIGPIYEQVDQLIALGALKEVNRGIMLDGSYPFYDDIVSIVTSTAHYMDMRILLDRIDSLLKSGYYITGYLAARQNGPPVDHEQDSALVAVLDPTSRHSNYLIALSAVSPTDLKWLAVDSVPNDITRQDMYGSTIWIASVERGLIDCVVHQDCSIYVIALLLLQNIMDGMIDTPRLLQMAGVSGVEKILITFISEFNRIADDNLVSLEATAVSDARKSLDPHRVSGIMNAAKDAFNTLMEG